MGSMPAVPGTGKEERGESLTREELQEQERLRKEAIKATERERHLRYKKQEEEREKMRQTLRDKYNIEKKVNEEEEEDDSDFEGSKNVEDDLDGMALAQKRAGEAAALFEERCTLQ